MSQACVGLPDCRFNSNCPSQDVRKDRQNETDAECLPHDSFVEDARTVPSQGESGTQLLPLETVQEEEFEKYFLLLPSNLKRESIDMLIINSDADKQNALKFRQNLEKDIPIPLPNGLTWSPNVKLLDEVVTVNPMDHLEEAFELSVFVFLFVTKTFCRDLWKLFEANVVLMKAIKDPQKRWCVVPVLTNSKKKTDYKVPFLLTSLKPINYWSQDQSFVDAVRNLLEMKIFDCLEKASQLRIKKEEYVRDHLPELKRKMEIPERKIKLHLPVGARDIFQKGDKDLEKCHSNTVFSSTLRTRGGPEPIGVKAQPMSDDTSIESGMQNLTIDQRLSASGQDLFNVHIRDNAQIPSAHLQEPVSRSPHAAFQRATIETDSDMIPSSVHGQSSPPPTSGQAGPNMNPCHILYHPPGAYFIPFPMTHPPVTDPSMTSSTPPPTSVPHHIGLPNFSSMGTSTEAWASQQFQHYYLPQYHVNPQYFPSHGLYSLPMETSVPSRSSSEGVPASGYSAPHHSSQPMVQQIHHHKKTVIKVNKAENLAIGPKASIKTIIMRSDSDQSSGDEDDEDEDSDEDKSEDRICVQENAQSRVQTSSLSSGAEENTDVKTV